MIDTHCHIDLYENPLEIVTESEQKRIITIGMTNLPSHFELGYQHILHCKFVRLALGMHPLYAEKHKNELSIFSKNLSKTSYIGEIGLDFSKEGISTKHTQLQSFEFILEQLKGKKKLLSIHSRRAEKEVLKYLIQYNIKHAIFHWYSGPLNLIDEIVKAGYHFSINSKMVKSISGQEIIKKIPIKNILTETDGPFIQHNGATIKPSDISTVEEHLSSILGIPTPETSRLIYKNFIDIIYNLK